MPINIYSTQTMLKATEKMLPVRSFLKDNFFPFNAGDTFVTEEVLIDFRKGKRKMAPFVAPRIGGITMDRQGFRTDRYKAPRIAPQRVLTMDDLALRGIGENVFSSRTPADRQAELLGKDLAELGEMTDRREEWMCREVLLSGKITMKGYIDEVGGSKYVEQVLDFGFDNEFEPENLWDQAGSTIYADIRAMRDLIMQKSGMAPTDMILDTNVVDAFLADADIKAKFDNTRYNLGVIAPTLFMDGAVTYLGRLTEFGIDLWTYTEWFEDDSGVLQPMIPYGQVVMLTRNLGRRLYGAVTQMEADGNFYTYEGVKVPKVWSEQSNDTKMIRVSTRPVPAPYDVDSWAVANVLTPEE